MNLERKFVIESERRYLLKNPTLAVKLALNYKKDFLNLAEEFKALETRNQILEQRNQSLLVDNQLLTFQLIEVSEPKTVSLPSFLNCHRH